METRKRKLDYGAIANPQYEKKAFAKSQVVILDAGVHQVRRIVIQKVSQIIENNVVISQLNA